MDEKMVKAVKIVLERWEGRPSECVKVELVSEHPWESASSMMAVWRRSAPEGGGYHKVGFKVFYADGEEYEGRYDMQKGDYSSLGAHMFAFLKHAVSEKRVAENFPKLAEGAKEFVRKGYEVGHDFGYNEELKGLL